MDRQEALEKDLARIIGFVNNCDSKTSIILGSVLAAVSLLIGLGASSLTSIDNGSVFFYVVIILCAASAFLIIIGVLYLLKALHASIEPEDYLSGDESAKRSPLFFGNVADMTFPEYKELVASRDTETYVEELESQIYINSQICKDKFENYNKGLVCSFLGLLILFVCVVLSYL